MKYVMKVISITNPDLVFESIVEWENAKRENPDNLDFLDYYVWENQVTGVEND